MADLKISQLTGATTPLAGTEVLPIVQSGSTKKVTTNDLTVKNVRSNATTGILQVVGPNAGTTCIMTVPNANFTAARTDASQTFSNNQIVEGDVIIRRSSGDYTGLNITSGGTDNPVLNFNMNDGSWRYRFNMNSDTDIKFQIISGGSPYTSWQVDRVTALFKVVTADLQIVTAGKGIIMTNADGTLTKRVRLNNTGDGLVFENP